jgi:hypothetical protein
MDERTEERLYPAPPENRAELLQRIEAEWQLLQNSFTDLPAAQLTAPGEGGWAIKDHVAHVTFWEQWLLRRILGGEPLAAVVGAPEAALTGLDTDGLNDIIYRRTRDRTPEQVLDDAQRSHEELTAALGQMPFDELARPRFPDRPEEGPLVAWVVGNTYGHYMEHAATIQRQAGR